MVALTLWGACPTITAGRSSTRLLDCIFVRAHSIAINVIAREIVIFILCIVPQVRI